jgi:gluconolactonase
MLDVYNVVDRAFFDLVSPVIPPQEIYAGGLFTEGPAYFPAGRYLLFTDIPNDRILRFDETNSAVGVFRENCGHPNGQTVDPNGRLLSCEHRHRRVSRTEHDGRIVTVADSWQGKRLNSPNDVIVASDGAVWFTDPTYGILHDLDGARATPEIDGCHVYRVCPITGAVEAKITDMVMPNGLALSADETTLYVVDSGKSHFEGGPAHVRAFRIGGDLRLTGGEALIDCPQGIFDGLRLDREGNLWIGAGDGIYCYTPQGHLLGSIALNRIVGNLAFGGPRGNILYVCATDVVYRLPVKVNGLRR